MTFITIFLSLFFRILVFFFEKLRSKKVKDHRMSSDIKGAICTRDGMDKKDFKTKLNLRPGDKIKVKYFDYKRTRGVCYNKHGPRCDRKFLKEKECYYQRVNGKCCLWSGGRPGYNKCVAYPLRSHKEISEQVCPYPCGCIFSGKPKRKTSAIKTKTKDGSVVHKTNNLTEEVEIISLGTKNSITSSSTFILISTAFLNFDVLNQ